MLHLNNITDNNPVDTWRKQTSWTSSKRLMHVQFTFCVYEEEILENCKTICLTKLPLLKNLKTYVNPFHGAVRNIATWAEVAVSIVNALLSSRKWRMFKRIHRKTINISWKRFFSTNQKERYSNHHRKEKTREISIFKEDWQNLGVFIANYPFKK